MFSKKGTRKKVVREKRNTTDAIVKYQKDTAGVAHANNVDEEVNDFVIIEKPGDEDFVVIDTFNLKLSGYTAARNDTNARPQGAIVEKGARLNDKTSSTAPEQLIVGTGGVSDEILCYPAGDRLLIARPTSELESFQQNMIMTDNQEESSGVMTKQLRCLDD